MLFKILTSFLFKFIFNLFRPFIMKKIKTLVLGLTGILAVHATTPAVAEAVTATGVSDMGSTITQIIDLLTKLVIACGTLYHMFKPAQTK